MYPQEQQITQPREPRKGDQLALFTLLSRLEEPFAAKIQHQVFAHRQGIPGCKRTSEDHQLLQLLLSSNISRPISGSNILIFLLYMQPMCETAKTYNSPCGLQVSLHPLESRIAQPRCISAQQSSGSQYQIRIHVYHQPLYSQWTFRAEVVLSKHHLITHFF
jgi:hypothetical protein